MKRAANICKVCGCVILALTILLALTGCSLIGAIYLIDAIIFPYPEKPAVTYGEFPFTIVYEIDGEVKTIEDTYICEYQVRNNTSSMGKFRYWTMHLASDPDEIYPTFWEEGNVKLNCKLGVPEYFMGDIESYNIYSDSTEYVVEPIFYETTIYEDGTQTSPILSEDEVWEKYKIRIISYEISDPIENSFSE